MKSYYQVTVLHLCKFPVCVCVCAAGDNRIGCPLSELDLSRSHPSLFSRLSLLCLSMILSELVSSCSF
ncbi:hypothetical protein PHET_02957 [Paragonimus heterotremus]|uniref:Uncharacterized protein n=1 Tax=Paragonimus heterotremus TaxID=100268 RepID=A0A8J4T1G7_9TREM|nr:hypothetical protein PHET_02957 [Paragonimus heterotremus]